MAKEGKALFFAIKRKNEKRQKQAAELRSIDSLVREIVGLEKRLACVHARLAEDGERQGLAVSAAQAGASAMIWGELLARWESLIGRCETDAARGKRLDQDGTIVSQTEEWKTVVLEKKHVEKYGERRCEGCKRYVDTMDRVAYRKSDSAKIWHLACKPTDEKKAEKSGQQTRRVFTLAANHIKKHGERACSKCGEIVREGARVMWTPGTTTIDHEECVR